MSPYWYLFLVALIPFTYPTADIGNTEITLETAVTDEEKRIGLMNRSHLPEDQGMIFIYEEEDDRSFWMKNTEIPLDIIFLDGNMTVINIEKAEPGVNISEENLPSYRSDRPAQYVLEINQNRSEELGLDEGNEVNLGWGVVNLFGALLSVFE